jgi:hypothetical protein
MRSSALLLVTLAVAPALGAEERLPPIPIRRASSPIKIDGDLSDPAWKDAAAVEPFYETSPGDNTPPKVRTMAWVAYDDRYFYLAVRCDDPQPDKIRAPYVDRDQVVGTDDNVAIFLDTRNERRSAMEFRINPRGIQADGMWNEANFNEDFSPDFYYDTAARITATGWEGEFRIPFSSLRYPDADPQTWGLMIWRNYPRDFRYGIYSNPIPRGSNGYLVHMREMVGISGLPQGIHFVVAPHVTASQNASPRDPADIRSDFESEPVDEDGGIDAKLIPNPDLVLDVAVNPDFSQIESDVAQIGVNQRFALFYPEKRPFFLEGVDLLDTRIRAVYTRTITNPAWGARATGQLGKAAYTVLTGKDDGGGLVILPGPTFSDFAPQDFESVFGIARIRRDLGGSFLGFLFTDREVDGGGHNRVLGPDFQWTPNQKDQVSGQLLYADTTTPDRPELAAEWDGRELAGAALDAGWRHVTPTAFWRVDYRDFDEEFRADNGFVPQVGYREATSAFGWNFFPNGFWNFVSPSIGQDYVEDRGGSLLTRRLVAEIDFQGRRNLAGFVAYMTDTIRFSDLLFDRKQVQWSVQVDPSRRVPRVGIFGFLGDEVDFENARPGDGGDLGIMGTFRPQDHLQFDLNADRRWLDVEADGRKQRLFTAIVARLKATYTFSARSFVRLVGQYVETERDPALYGFPVAAKEGGFDGSALFGYKLNWQSVLFFGYGQSSVLAPELASGVETNRFELVPVSRELFLKVSYAFQR